MSNNKKYWKGIEELNDSPVFQEVKHKEFSEYIPVEEFLGEEENTLESSNTTRRDFLKYLGFGVTAASLAACEAPVVKAIPYLVKSDKVKPGVPNYYATAFSDGHDYVEIVVKNREGRPIKIDGNKKSPFTRGAINARVNSSVLELYDGKRLKAPQIGDKIVNWGQFNSTLRKQIENAISSGKKVRLMTASIYSPSTLRLIDKFKEEFAEGDVQHVTYDAISYSGMLEANKASFGILALPNYDLTKTKSIVSIGADFLNSFPNSIALTSQYGESRRPTKGWMSKHFQFESSFSLTGTNADVRVPVKPSEHAAIVASLYNQIAAKTGGQKISAVATEYEERIKQAADHLLKNKGESIVLCGLNDASTQIIVNEINNLLGNYGNTLDIENPLYLNKGIDAEVNQLISDMKAGKVGVLITSGINPVYNMPSEKGFKEAMAKVKTTVAFSLRPNETTAESTFLAATHHYLEAWNDYNPVKGHYVLAQPTIRPLFDTNQLEDTLMALTKQSGSYHDYIKENWKSLIAKEIGFEDFWINTLHEGYYAAATIKEATDNQEEGSVGADINAAASKLPKPASVEWEIEFYQKVGIGNGNHAYNPWLQELPDPVSKMTWDNYIAMNPSDARENGFATEYGEQKDADTINITINGTTFKGVPVIAQPGQARGTLSVAVGYGQVIGKKDEVIGFNVYPAISTKNNPSNYSTEVSFESAGKSYPVATTQTHHTIMGRDSIVKETDWSTYANGSKEDYNPAHELHTHAGLRNVKDVTIWNRDIRDRAGHLWGMSIDLNACIGCGACVTSCNSENNIPVVGKDEVRRSREMHWIRIDRYFSSAEEQLPKSDRSYRKLEVPEDNPMVVHQPMMCQHCNDAPCETVCPVAATTHSNEGLNQMTYNRCIGTRYCANNCPYKVRRFNWFSYKNLEKFADLNPSQDDLGRMVLNPDVTVRSRGVMEKCSMCVQRIQDGKLTAKKEGRMVLDGEIETACASACPTNAITFGDLNDTESKVHKESISDRSFRVIEEIGTDANVYYQVKVRNIEKNNLA